MRGLFRDLTRPQAQRTLPLSQTRFDGGENSDSPASKLRFNELALAVDVIPYRDSLEGPVGQNLYTPFKQPGSGAYHGRPEAHPRLGRVLAHRGGKLWLSDSPAMLEWVEAKYLGPDGALSATGMFGDGTVSISGGVAAVLSNMVLQGVTPGQNLVIAITEGAGPSITVIVSTPEDEELCSGTMLVAEQPDNLVLTESGGSGISGSVDVDGYTDPVAVGSGVVQGSTPLSCSFRGLRSNGLGGSWSVDGTAAEHVESIQIEGAGKDDPFQISIEEGSGGSFTVKLLRDSVVVAEKTDCVFPGVTAGVLVPVGSSGVTARVDIVGIPASGYGSYTGDVAYTPTNNDGFKLYPKIVVYDDDGLKVDVEFYKDSGRTLLVAAVRGHENSPAGDPTPIIGKNGSDLLGVMPWTIPTLSAGEFMVSDLVFEAEAFDIAAESKIEPYGNGFLVHIPGHMLFVDARTAVYWPHATAAGIGKNPIASVDDGTAHRYRYLYTFCRIENADGTPTLFGDRTTAALVFEGPSNGFVMGQVDSDPAVFKVDFPPDVEPIDVRLSSTETGNTPVALDAAAYATHVGVYRTGDIGPEGKNPLSGDANDPDGFVWVKDVPIQDVEFEDSTSDDLLRTNYGGDRFGFLTLKSRFFEPMPKGTGAVSEDYLLLAEREGKEAHYCSLVFPRFIGYNYQGNYESQFYRTRFSIRQILRTRNIFVILGDGATIACDSSIFIEPGNGVEHRPVIRSFTTVSETVGLKYFGSYTRVDENSFAAICSDGTVRVFSGSEWGGALDAPRDDSDGTVHKMTSKMVDGACLAYIRDTLLLFYCDTCESGDLNEKCLRYGFGGFAGSRWSRLARPSFVRVPKFCGPMVVGNKLVCADGITEGWFSVEDARRKFTDDGVESAPVLRGAGNLMNLVFPGWDGEHYYARVHEFTEGQFRVELYESEEDREAGEGRVGESAGFTGPQNALQIEVDGFDDSATVDVLLAEEVDFEVVPGLAVVEQVNIPGRFRIPEVARGNLTVIHEESHVMVEPAGASLPEGFSLTARALVDGVIVPGSELVGAPVNGDIQYRASVEGLRLQQEFETNASGFRITAIHARYATQDKTLPVGPSNTPEFSYQRELETDILSWVNGVSGLVDRVLPSAKYSGSVTAITDPVGKNRGQQFPTTPSSQVRAITVDDYCLMAWVKAPFTANNVETASIFRARALGGSPQIAMYFSDTSTLRVAGGLGVALAVPLTGPVGWQHVAICRQGDLYTCYQNGALLGEVSGGAAGALAIADMLLGASGGEQKAFDLRLYGKVLTAAALAYYVDDVRNNEGRKVLP